MIIGERVIVTEGMLKKEYVGQQGTVTGIRGEVVPFHYDVKLDSGIEICARGDELEITMQCGKCDSKDIFIQFDVGYDVDESGGENQHLSICKSCGAWRLHTERYVNFSQLIEYFGSWQDKEEHPIWL